MFGNGFGRVESGVEDIFEENVSSCVENRKLFVRDSVSVLLEETINFVSDINSIMGNREGSVAESWLLVYILVVRFVKLLVKFGEEGGIGPRG